MDNIELSILRNEDLINNPTARIAVCLCLDTSNSMNGNNKIDLLNQGIEQFYNEVMADEIACLSLEICIVKFGGETASLESDFSSLKIQSKPPVLEAEGNTPMGEAVNIALDKLEQRKNEYKDLGVDYYQPWLIIMSDGAPNKSVEELERAIKRTRDLVTQRKLTVFSIGIGEDANMQVLDFFSPKTHAIKMDGFKFKEFFEFLSSSVSHISQGSPADIFEPDENDIKKFANLDETEDWGDTLD